MTTQLALTAVTFPRIGFSLYFSHLTAMHSPTLIVGFLACSAAGYRYKEIIPSHMRIVCMYVITYLICIHLSFFGDTRSWRLVTFTFPIFIKFPFILCNSLFSLPLIFTHQYFLFLEVLLIIIVIVPFAIT